MSKKGLNGSVDLLAQAMRKAFKDANEGEAEALEAKAQDANRPNEASEKECD